MRGELPLARAALALGEHRADHLGDDVAGLAHDDGVADAHVFARHFVLVVQRGEPEGVLLAVPEERHGDLVDRVVRAQQHPHP